MKNNPTIAIIGLGYVGLPLAVAFAKKYSVIGFDINKKRVAELNSGTDATLEVSDGTLKAVLKTTAATGLLITDDAVQMKAASVYIVTVPTPTNKYT
ncbi:MAG: hypothetical protein ACPG7E_06360 [Marinirhabdus sp.]